MKRVEVKSLGKKDTLMSVTARAVMGGADAALRNIFTLLRWFNTYEEFGAATGYWDCLAHDTERVVGDD